jgi:hypothetical protein
MAETNLNLNFKHGTQASLNGLTTSDKGTFYLTNDTNRLYIGTGSAPVLLNQTVNIISGIAALPTPEEKLLNDFYYCANENVLAVCVTATEDNKTIYKWHQINKNTNDDTRVSGISVEKNAN